MKTTRDLEEMRDVLNEARMSLNVLLRKKIDIPFLNLVNDAILKRLAQIDGEINTIKNSCDHNWEWYCSGHNDDLYKCTICGEVEWR